MLQVEHTLATPVSPCACGQQPKDLEIRGKHRTLDPSEPPIRHALECCRCRERTAEHGDLQAAIAEWEASHGA